MVEIKCPLCGSFVAEVGDNATTNTPIRTFCYALTHSVQFQLQDGKLTHLSAVPREKKQLARAE